MSITKKDIVKNIIKNTSITSEESSKILEIFLKLIKLNSNSKLVKLNKFGSFKYKKTLEREGRNPKTKEIYKIKAFKKLTFNPSIQLKKNIN